MPSTVQLGRLLASVVTLQSVDTCSHAKAPTLPCAGAGRYILGVLVMLFGVIMPLAYALVKRRNPFKVSLKA